MSLVSLGASRRRLFVQSCVALLALAVSRLGAAVPAFPGAEGFGVNTSGARGGTVYHVTNLNDSGAGSFRDAVSVAGRTVVFDVGGIITLTSPVTFKNNITVAGQTAPGEGITFYGDRFGLSGVQNIIMRFIRVREGINGDSGTDAMSADSGDRMIFDHVSVSWGRDETFSFNGTASNVTIQDCIIGQGLLIHSAGGLIQTSGGVSIFRTLYTDNYMRNPKVKGVNDYQNNVVYNYGTGGGYIPAGDSAGLTFANVINNYFISGPVTQESPFKTGNKNYSIYHSGNFQDQNINGALDGVLVTDSSFPTLNIVGTQFAYNAPATLLTAQQAYNHIVAYSGASLHRDGPDTFMLNELTSNGTVGAHIFNESEVGGVGTVAGGLTPKDTDGDGMPDWWEEAAGTNPLVADNNGDIDGDGYTNLENYINAIAFAGVPAATIDGIATDTGLLANDGVTKDNTLVLNGTAAAGLTVTIARVDTGAIGTAIADGTGHWTFDYSATVLPDRYYAFMATVDLGGGKISPPTKAFVVKVDTVAAAAPVITSIVSSPSFTINGTSEPGSKVDVTLVSVGVVGTATTDGLGNWSAPYTGAPLAPGVYSFTAAATDVAGNAGADSAPYVVDTSLAAPVFTSITTDSGASASDLVTNDQTLVLNGTSFANAIISVTRVGTGVIGTANASAGGAWSFDYTATTLPAGQHTFFASASNGTNSSPASTNFVVTIDRTAPVVSSIRRQNPTTTATTASTLVYRVTFSEPVSGVDLTDFALTVSGATGTLASVSPVSSTIYDVTVNSAAGDGTIRVDLKSSGTGIVDVAGNAVSGGFTTGQTFTIRLPGSGVWISSETGEVWSQATDWEAGIIANGTGATADFSTINVDGPISVTLDSARTVGRVQFGDTDFTNPALWTVTNGGTAGNVLTLATATGTPNIVVNAATTPTGDTADVPAANAFPSTLDVSLAGSQGFTKTGVGTILLTQPNTITGPLTITKGIVEVGVGGSLAMGNNPTTISTSQQLRVSGGTYNTLGNVSWTSGTGTGIIVSGGVANFQKIIPSNTRNSFFRVTGGTVTLTDINFPRSGDSESQAIAAGIFIQGGNTTAANIGLGTVDSWGAMTVSGGKLTVTGVVHDAFQVTSTRGGVINVSGGEFNVLDTTLGLVMARNPATDTPARASQTNQTARFLISGGVSNLGKLTVGYDATSSAGVGTITLATGELNMGAGGIVKNGTAGFVVTATLSSGTLGAYAPWSTTLPWIVSGTPSTLFLRAANSVGAPFDYSLNGVLSGSGGFAKTGAGTITLGATNTFTGNAFINAGTLKIDGSTAPAAGVQINAGGTLGGGGTVQGVVFLAAGGAISPGTLGTVGTLNGNSVLTWNPGGKLVVDAGATGVSDKIAWTSAVGKVSAGTYEIAFNPLAGFAIGNTYTIATYASTNFVASDFTASGLPVGLAANFTVNPTSLQVTIVHATQTYADWTVAKGIPAGQTGFTSDPDADGINNLLEYYLGLNPMAADTTGLPAGKIEGAEFVFRFTHSKSATGVTAEVQVSSDLSSWAPSGVAPTLESETADTETLVVKLPLTAPRLFVRLVLNAP